ncbi:WD domain [Trypanosoma vivax]|uniref:Uncharacterized protein n=1 Tax=Trypanosoma vivax (strain Y486) TaxID=1055687 RepID=G0TWV6_TRYVY|nr:hypothetical protein TRVL_07089 [Trypanosoma vivax]KAH8614007.1 WD domain [Trypanosoma vivax]CCC48444.1 conserved hypothetical protein [Trypanosoma vivax Y486]
MRGSAGRRQTQPSSAPGTKGPPTSVALPRLSVSRPSRVVQELHRNDGGNSRSVRGQQIATAVNELMDEVYGGTAHEPPPRLVKPAVDEDKRSISVENYGDSPYARYRTSFLSDSLPESWRRGPIDSAGRCFDASDRNLLCMDVHAASKQCVVGSADHGLKVFDITSGKEKKNLYTKKYGHTEWVTCCKYFQSNGKIISGGMDSKLCLWEATGPARCTDLMGHTGSISHVEVNCASQLALSSSYDRTLRLWDCAAAGRCIATFAGHKAPVMMFSWCGAQLLSGDRQGTAKVWDIERGSCLATMATKRGQISSLWHLLSSDVGLLSAIGDQGGVLCVMDFLRTGSKPIFSDALHPGGAITGIRSVDESSYLITAGADKVILVLDPRAGFKTLHRFTDHRDFIYSLETFGPLVLSGGANGWLLVHDVIEGNCCYGLGANTAAVRCIHPMREHLVAAGDDGKAMVYDFQ